MQNAVRSFARVVACGLVALATVCFAAEKPRIQVDSYIIHVAVTPQSHQLKAQARVKFTALDARQLGFDTFLIEDGCRGVELKAGDHMLRRIPKALHAPYLAVTGIFPAWKDTWLLLAQKPSGWKPRELSREELSKMFVDFEAGHYPGY